MAEQKLTVVVPEELAGKRLDQVLSRLCPQHSRSRLQAWIQAGRVTVDRQVLRQRDAVRSGAEIELAPIYEAQPGWIGEDLPLQIIHEDEELIILDKPPGLVVHPGAGNPRHTLLNALLHHAPALERVPRAGIVQRLDKDTSGIMVIAKTPETHTLLVEQLRQRQVSRQYQAVVNGVITAGGSIEAPIGRHPSQRKRMAVVQGGKPARTHYRILKKYPAHTHLLVVLDTGRTHQIRVHMAHLHHPVTGDPVYGARHRLPAGMTPQLREFLRGFPRQALHAWRIGLVHPRSGRVCSWTAPPAADLLQLLAALDEAAGSHDPA